MKVWQRGGKLSPDSALPAGSHDHLFLCPPACKHKSKVLHLCTFQRGLQEMTEVVLFPSVLGKMFHPKEPYWECWLSILPVARAENVGAYRSLSHCHSGLTAPCIDQGWHQEPHSAAAVKWEPQPFQQRHQQVPSTPALCVGSQHKQRRLSEITGEEEIWVFL